MYDQYGYETFIFLTNIGLLTYIWVNCLKKSTSYNKLSIHHRRYEIQCYLQIYIPNKIRWPRGAKLIQMK